MGKAVQSKTQSRDAQLEACSNLLLQPVMAAVAAFVSFGGEAALSGEDAKVNALGFDSFEGLRCRIGNSGLGGTPAVRRDTG